MYLFPYMLLVPMHVSKALSGQHIVGKVAPLSSAISWAFDAALFRHRLRKMRWESGDWGRRRKPLMKMSLHS